LNKEERLERSERKYIRKSNQKEGGQKKIERDEKKGK
jgi:hypothetical protein